MTRSAVVCFAAFCITTRTMPGQQERDTTAAIAGTVRSSINGLPIGGVTVTVRGTRVFGVSDSAGAFTLTGLPSGQRTVRVLYPDSVPHNPGDTLAYDQDFTLHGRTTLRLSVLLDLDAQVLTPVVVEENTSRAERSLAGFFDRKKQGIGTFYTRADLDRLHAPTPQTLLTQAGVTMRCRLRRCVPLVYQGGGAGGQLCVMSLFVNGLRVATDYLDAVRVEDLAAVEVYLHPFDVPARFRIGFGRDDCGAVLLWVKH